LRAAAAARFRSVALTTVQNLTAAVRDRSTFGAELFARSRDARCRAALVETRTAAERCVVAPTTLEHLSATIQRLPALCADLVALLGHAAAVADARLETSVFGTMGRLEIIERRQAARRDPEQRG
jgi:hypothetical protein